MNYEDWRLKHIHHVAAVAMGFEEPDGRHFCEDCPFGTENPDGPEEMDDGIAPGAPPECCFSKQNLYWTYNGTRKARD